MFLFKVLLSVQFFPRCILLKFCKLKSKLSIRFRAIIAVSHINYSVKQQHTLRLFFTFRLQIINSSHSPLFKAIVSSDQIKTQAIAAQYTFVCLHNYGTSEFVKFILLKICRFIILNLFPLFSNVIDISEFCRITFIYKNC